MGYGDDMTRAFGKPWLNKKYREDIQDTVEYWNDPKIVIQAARNTVEEILVDPKVGIEDGGVSLEVIDNFCKEFEIPKGANILELGCGGGIQSHRWKVYSERFVMDFHIIGIDHAQNSIDICNTRLPDLEFLCKRATELPFDDRKMDVIYTNTMLQHNGAHRLHVIFDGIYDTLKSDGYLFILNELVRDSFIYPKYHPPPEFYMEPWSSDERGSAGTAAWWIGMIADHGFELMWYEKSSFVFKRIERVVRENEKN